MHLNRSSDFALRLMMFLTQVEGPVSIATAASKLKLAKSQLMKITAMLAEAGFVETRRGPGGGIQACGRPGSVRVGDVVRAIENDFGVVDCLREGPCDCVFLPNCALTRVMAGATSVFMNHLDKHTLADVTAAAMPNLTKRRRNARAHVQ